MYNEIKFICLEDAAYLTRTRLGHIWDDNKDMPEYLAHRRLENLLVLIEEQIIAAAKNCEWQTAYEFCPIDLNLNRGDIDRALEFFGEKGFDAYAEKDKEHKGIWRIHVSWAQDHSDLDV
jgi:hypothetical protein